MAPPSVLPHTLVASAAVTGQHEIMTLDPESNPKTVRRHTTHTM